ncbi:MAG: Tat pathway signal protein [Kiritimatiellae bacterium]|nr:Tat pathway signal protein [Kiritimatiellia bacterium]
MSVSRRDFIRTAAGAAALGAVPSVARAAASPEPKFIWSYLAHFGVNSWKDVPLETQDPNMEEKWLTRCCADHVRFDEPSWRKISDALVKAGCNQIIIDLAEIVVYPSHPELAVKGSWSVERLRAEIARLRGMGFEVIPKLNFSACHDTWLKDYHRMVSSKKYYQVCEDLIKDVAEIFDHPRFFHLGYDEETAAHQAKHLFAVCRQGDLWWHDFLWFVGVTEKTGCRPWIWSDYCWNHKDEFMKRMPKSVLQSNWYYGAEFDVSKLSESRRPHVQTYEDLDKAGFEQVPTGSNWSCDTNFADTIKFCDTHCHADLIKGYMMAPWTRTFAIHEEKAMQAIAQMAAAIKARS